MSIGWVKVVVTVCLLCLDRPERRSVGCADQANRRAAKGR
jgi:hypothetical protein